MSNIIIQIISILIQVVVNTYIIVKLAEIFDKTTYDKRQKVVSFIFITLGVLLGTALKGLLVINTIAMILPIFLLLVFILKVKWFKSLLISIIFMALLAITELTTVYLALSIFKVDTTQLLNSAICSGFIVLTQYSLNALIIKLVSIFFEKRLKFVDGLQNISFKQTLILLSALAFCILPQMVLFITNYYDYPISFLFINSIQFIVICVFLFIYLKNTIEFEKTQNDLITSELHNKTMATMVDGVRTLKHDYNNIIQALNRIYFNKTI